MLNRPEQDEFAPYYSTYISLVPEGDIMLFLNSQMEEIAFYLKEVTEEQGKFRYASGKWSLKEVIGHMTDTERIMAYRLLCISRGEKVSLPGFDEQIYVENASFDNQTIGQLLEHLSIVRQSTVLLIKSLDEKSLLTKGTINNTEATVRALIYIICGHMMHHVNIIKERYIASSDFPA